jgi:hypothetical protein
MLISLDEQALVDDLCAHFLQSGFTAEQVGGGSLQVTRPHAANAREERIQILLHLRIWQTANPGVRVSHP